MERLLRGEARLSLQVSLVPKSVHPEWIQDGNVKTNLFEKKNLHSTLIQQQKEHGTSNQNFF